MVFKYSQKHNVFEGNLIDIFWRAVLEKTNI